MGFLSEADLRSIGFAGVGRNVLISSKASIYNPGQITIGDHVRIDDFCVISAGSKGIRIGRHVHIAVFCSLIGHEQIVLEDFSGLSARVSIYSSSEDYSGNSMTNPTVADAYRSAIHGPVVLGRHVIVGAGSVILPGVTLQLGCAVGALSLVNRSHPEFSIVSGVPARRIARRNRDLLAIEAKMNGCESDGP